MNSNKTAVANDGRGISLLQENGIGNSANQSTSTIVHDGTEKRHVYGIAGIAKLFGCSMPTAHRIKKSGKIDRTTSHKLGGKIIVDAELALELAGRKTGGKKMTMETRNNKIDLDALWQKSLVRVTDEFNVPPVILQVDDAIIGTLGNFSASTGKAKAKKTFNVSAIVASALINGQVLEYRRHCPKGNEKNSLFRYGTKSVSLQKSVATHPQTCRTFTRPSTGKFDFQPPSGKMLPIPP